jgi:hypothetical protein
MGGSPFWQTAFLFASILILIWQTWRGWRAGLFRSGVNFAAILVSAVLGLLGAEVAAILRRTSYSYGFLRAQWLAVAWVSSFFRDLVLRSGGFLNELSITVSAPPIRSGELAVRFSVS